MADGVRNAPVYPAMTQVPGTLLEVFNNRGYPRINPNTYDLEWYVPTEDFQSKLEVLSEISASMGGILQGLA
jgi:hypothetical protein